LIACEPDNSLRDAIHGKPFQDAFRKIGGIDLSTPNGPLEVIKAVFMSGSMILACSATWCTKRLRSPLSTRFLARSGVRHYLGRYLSRFSRWISFGRVG